MKYIGVLVVLAIIYVLYARQGASNSIQKAMSESDAIMAPANAPSAASQGPIDPGAGGGSGYRRPLDRTRAVLGQVKKNNAENGF